MLRQGDILLVEVDTVPAGYELRTPARLTLGHGEVTGHTHTLERACWIVAPQTTAEALFQFAVSGQTDAPVFVLVEEDTVLTHQEHEALTIPAGTYRIVRQREYTPQAIRSVMD